MSSTFRHWKGWWFRIALAGLVVWLAQGILFEKVEISQVTLAGQAQRLEDRKPVVFDRAPRRFIKDPNPAFSAVAVNSEHNMLVVTDENLFQILEYDSRANT